MPKIIFLVLLLTAISFGYWKHNQNIQQQAVIAEQAQHEKLRTEQQIKQSIRDSLNNNNSKPFRSDPNNNSVVKEISSSTATAFKCDGRTHCSSMRSYEEAKYYLDNCPNTEMDGDHDGIPCERQFNR